MYKPRRESYSDRRPSAPRYGDSYPRRENRDRGGFGGGRDREERPSFEATCAKCGSSCRVPFKPNGSKPVLCKVCFEQDGGGSRDRDRGESRGRDSYQDRGRDSYQEKPMVRSLERESARPAASANLELQLNRIEAKLNSILESLGGKTEKKAKIEEVKEVVKEAKKEVKAEKEGKVKKETKEKKTKKAKKEPEEEIIFE